MNNKLRHIRDRVITKSRETAELAAQLAPPEEQPTGQEAGAKCEPHHHPGTIVVDTGELKLPQGIGEEKQGAKLLDVNPIVAFIFIFSIIFIAYISYLIATE